MGSCGPLRSHDATPSATLVLRACTRRRCAAPCHTMLLAEYFSSCHGLPGCNPTIKSCNVSRFLGCADSDDWASAGVPSTGTTSGICLSPSSASANGSEACTAFTTLTAACFNHGTTIFSQPFLYPLACARLSSTCNLLSNGF